MRGYRPVVILCNFDHLHTMGFRIAALKYCETIASSWLDFICDLPIDDDTVVVPGVFTLPLDFSGGSEAKGDPEARPVIVHSLIF